MFPPVSGSRVPVTAVKEVGDDTAKLLTKFDVVVSTRISNGRCILQQLIGTSREVVEAKPLLVCHGQEMGM